MLSYPSLSLHVMIMSWHQVQHTPSSQDCLSSLHSHDSKLTTDCRFSFRCASLHDRPPSASSSWELKGKVSLSHSHSCELTNWWIQSQHPVHRPSTSSKYSCRLAWLWPPSSLDHCLQAYFQTRSILASTLARSRPLRVSPNSVDYSLQSHSITASKCIAKLAGLWPASLHDHGHQLHIAKLDWSRPPSVSPNSLDYSLHKCISKLPRSRSRSASLSSVDHCLQEYLQICSITASMCISNVARSQPRSVSLSSLDHHCQAQLELLSSAACSQSSYTMCRSVAI